MRIGFSKLNALLKEDTVLTYKMQYQLFYSPGELKGSTLWFADGAAMLLDHGLHMFGEEEVLDRFLGELPSGEYSLFGVACSLLPLLQKHFAVIDSDEDCTAYTLSPEDFTGRPEPLDNLVEAEAEFVNQHWTYKFPGSEEYFKHIINTYPSSVIRVDGKPAGWAVCYDAIEDMVNLGSLRVLEPYRNRGYGRKLASSLIAKVLALGKTPMIHILDSNIPSRNLSMGIGFKPYPKKIFWGSGVKK
jgi:GNAT superfamily N-acetyltransferase